MVSSRKKKKKKGSTKKDNIEGRLNGLKEEIARNLGLENAIEQRGWANLTSRETGKIGGYMAQRLRKKKKADP